MAQNISVPDIGDFKDVEVIEVLVKPGDKVNKNGYVNINISQVYRVLDFWTDLGLIHKISTINKFFLCITPEEKHTHMLNFCTVCEKVFETCNTQMGLNLKKSTAKLDLVLNNTHSIEIPVICPKCN